MIIPEGQWNPTATIQPGTTGLSFRLQDIGRGGFVMDEGPGGRKTRRDVHQEKQVVEWWNEDMTYLFGDILDHTS